MLHFSKLYFQSFEKKLDVDFEQYLCRFGDKYSYTVNRLFYYS